MKELRHVTHILISPYLDRNLQKESICECEVDTSGYQQSGPRGIWECEASWNKTKSKEAHGVSCSPVTVVVRHRLAMAMDHPCFKPRTIPEPLLSILIRQDNAVCCQPETGWSQVVRKVVDEDADVGGVVRC